MIKLKEEIGKTGLKLNILKTKIMTSSSITSWQIDGECSHEIERQLFLERKAMTKLNNILKTRHYFANTCLVKAIVFSEIIYGCESWTIKKT